LNLPLDPAPKGKHHPPIRKAPQGGRPWIRIHGRDFISIRGECFWIDHGEDSMVDRSSIAASTLTATLLLTVAGAQAQRVEQDIKVHSCPAIAETPTFEQVQAGMRTARNRGFLWRISKDGRDSYLYGTLHVAKHEWMYPGETMLRALKASDRVALELDLLDTDVAQRLNKAMVASGNDTALPEPLAARMRMEAERACFPLAALNTMIPEMQITTLEFLASRADGIYLDYGSELFLSGLARGLHKPVVSLETPELQMRAIRIENQQDRIAIVEKWLGKLESNRTRALQLRMSEMWADSRVDELRRFMEWCECAETEGERRYWRRLLDDRNPALAANILSILDSGQTVFAAVGSLHMIGTTGLPTLLTQRGYKVEFVASSP